MAGFTKKVFIGASLAAGLSAVDGPAVRNRNRSSHPECLLELHFGGGRFSQRVTPDSSLRRHALACVESGRQSRVRPRLLEGCWGPEKGKDLKEVGVSLRSSSQAQSDRHPEVPRLHGATRLRTPRNVAE
jgi:hypothetical protein